MSLSVTVNLDGIKDKLDGAIDDSYMTFAHAELARLSVPYVPMREGFLFRAIDITPDYIDYTAPYAHYQYTGDAMDMRTSEYTGAKLKYSKKEHPLAAEEWDKAMLQSKGDKFLKTLENELKRRVKNG